jgi:RNA polymerase sigma-70 factor, ECF subfamily
MSGSESAEGRVEPGESRFDAAFEAHYSKVLAFAIRRAKERQAAEDVAAETFAIAWRRRDAIPDAPLPWLYGIAVRVIANEWRSSTRRRQRERRFISDPKGSGRDPADIVGSRDAITAAFAALTESQREVLRLIAWEGLDHRTAASVLGCSEGAFSVRLFRARRSLAKYLAAGGHPPDEQAVVPRPCRAAEEAE